MDENDDENNNLEALLPPHYDDMEEFESKLEDLSQKNIPLFTQEYEKLLTTLQKSRDSEARLAARASAIVSEIKDGKDSVSQLEIDITDSSQLRKRLQLDIDVANATTEDYKKSSEEKVRAMEVLRKEIKDLKQQLLTTEDDSTTDMQINALKKEKLNTSKELDEQNALLNTLRVEVGQMLTSLTTAEEEHASVTEEISCLTTKVSTLRAESATESARRNALDRKLLDTKAKLEELKATAASQASEIEANEQALKVKEIHLRESKGHLELYLREYEKLNKTQTVFKEEAANQIATNKNLGILTNQIRNDIKIQTDTVSYLEKKIDKIQALISVTTDKISATESDKVIYEKNAAELNATVKSLTELEVEAELKQSTVLKIRNDDLLRESQVLEKMLKSAADRTQGTYDLIKVNENTIKNLTNEIVGYKKHVANQRRTVASLVADKEAYEAAAEASNKAYATALEQSKLQDLQKAALTTKITTAESKLKTQMNLYEAVRADRNLYSKNLIASTKEINEMKRRYKIMTHVIEQLKDEITSKDHCLVKEHFEHHRVDKERELLKNELTRIKKQIQSSESIIANQELEISKLGKIIAEADDERIRQSKELGAVINDRDNLRSQLISRNSETSVLCEKIRLQKSELAQGYASYESQLSQISEMKATLVTLKGENDGTSEQLGGTSHLKAEVQRLSRDVLYQKTKVKALSDELERPLNVHRWRRLEGSDPKRFGMIQKIAAMQKRLIKMTEKVAATDAMIHEKENLYVQLKQVLSRVPGEEVQETLVSYKANLKDKKAQHRALEAELDMYKGQVEQYKRDIKNIARDTKELEDRWLNEMKKYNNGENKMESEMEERDSRVEEASRS